MPDSPTPSRLGAVAIGRNEGTRLNACLRSVVGQTGATVYVDSGSTDGSVELARSLGVDVVELDTSIPFTAARARNAGYRRLCELLPEVELVQFVDGDCEVVDGWLAAAATRLGERSDLAVVCGRRRERFPEASLYNRLTDMEWDTPVGEAEACGGDAMYRRVAFDEVVGFDDTLICGEEPELCLRLRRSSWKVERLDREMTLHDADMHRLGQWWKRSTRGGWAWAEGASRYGEGPEHYNVKPSRSVWLWGAILPIASLAAAPLTLGLSTLALPAGYAVLARRVYRYRRTRGDSPADARLYALFTAVGKVPEAVGQAKFHWNRWRGRRATLIEYK